VAADVVATVLDETLALPAGERVVEAAPLIVKINDAIEQQVNSGRDAAPVIAAAMPRVIALTTEAMATIQPARRAELLAGGIPATAEELAYTEGVELALRQYLDTLTKLIGALVQQRMLESQLATGAANAPATGAALLAT
jgi:hypothetical protein